MSLRSCVPSPPQHQALTSYYREYKSELCNYACNRYGLSTQEAEDVVQLTFERVTGIVNSEEIRNVRAFLYKSVANASVDLLRRRSVRENYIKVADTNPDNELDDSGPESAAQSQQFLDIIKSALWAMPGKRRRLLLLNRVDGLSYAEIARRENLSETVVRKHVAKALANCQTAVREM